MIPRLLVTALAVTACGNVAPTGSDASGGPTDGSSPSDAAAMAISYRAILDQTTPVTYGGGPKNFCVYTITLKQLQLDLAILPSQHVSSGRLQDLNVEASPACPNPLIPPNIATYTLSSSTPVTGGQTLMFQGTATNGPNASLVATLRPAGSGYTAALTFHRTDTPEDVLAWTVTTTLTLAPQ